MSSIEGEGLSPATTVLSAKLSLEVAEGRFAEEHPGIEFSPRFIAEFPELLRRDGVDLRTNTLADFRALTREFLDSADTFAMQGKWQSVAAMLAGLNQAWCEAELGHSGSEARAEVRAGLERFALRVYEAGERRGRLNTQAIFCAQMATWLAIHPGEEVSPRPEGAPRDLHAFRHVHSRLERYADQRAIVDELYFGAVRWAAASALIAVEDLARLRSGMRALISTRLLEQAIKGSGATPSIIEGTQAEPQREYIRKMACGLYQLVRNPSLKESATTSFQDATEQVHAAHFIHLLLGTLPEWQTHIQRSMREREEGRALQILSLRDVSLLNARIAQGAASAWEKGDFQQACREACENFRAACREFAQLGGDKRDVDLVKAVAKKLQAADVSYHRAWGDLAIGVLESIAHPTPLMPDNQHACFAALCVLSQLVEKLPNGQTASRSIPSSGGSPVTADAQKLAEFQELLNWFGKRATELGVLPAAARHAWDYKQVFALTQAANPSLGEMPVGRREALDDVLQALCFFMRDLPAHHLHESGPDSAVLDYRICSSFAYSIGGFGTNENCAHKQQVDITPERLKEYGSLLHPHLGLQIGRHMHTGNLQAAAEGALQLLRDVATKLPQDVRDEKGQPLDLQVHYLNRLVTGALVFFGNQEHSDPYAGLQIVAIANQALKIAEPESLSIRDLQDPETSRLVLLAVTHEVIRRTHQAPFAVEDALKRPRTETAREPPAAEPEAE